MNQSAQADLQRAGLAFRQGDFSQAIDCAKRVVLQDQDNTDAHYILALSHSRLGNVEEAEAAFVRAASTHAKPEEVLHHQAAMYRAVEQQEKAEQCYLAALARNPDYVPSMLSRAALLSEQKRYDEAVNQYQEILTLDPQNVKAMSGLGAAYNALNKPVLAREALTKSLHIAPDNPVALNNIATTSLKLGELDTYVDYAERAYQVAPKNQDIAANLARAYERVGEADKSARLYQQAIDLNPYNTETHRDYSRFLWSLDKKGAYLDAVDHSLDKASEDERVLGLLLLKGELAYRAGDLNRAFDAYSRSLSIDQSVEAMMGRAGIHAARKQLSDAYSDYKDALRLAPANGEIRHEFATFLLGQHDFVRARETLAWEAPREHLQRQIALEATLDRAEGGERYRTIYNYDAFTTKMTIDPPVGYGTLDNFLTAVEEELSDLFNTTQQPIDQTLYGGTQTKGDLWETQNQVLLDLKNALFKTACRFVDTLSVDSDHPFLKHVPDMRTSFLEYAGSWAVKLQSGGGHVDHIHPEGWLSSAHYVVVPDAIRQGEGNGRGGWLRLGAVPIDGLDLPAEHYIRPEPGALILFPSYFWHGVEPFESDQFRITTPFDLISTAS